jgi:hypothetical protein
MILYGDRVRAVETRSCLATISSLALGAASNTGIARHEALVEALIAAGELLQGVADADLERLAEDDQTSAQSACMELLLTLARAVSECWLRGFTEPPRLNGSALEQLRNTDLPATLSCKVTEGYGYYAVYPELFLEAAIGLALSPAFEVIGLRSIGTSLSAIVAASVGARPVTLRPVGHPFDRKVKPSAQLRARLLNAAQATYLVVDEGPGLSGSSFAAVAEMLETGGVERDRIVFMPSHAGAPGGRGDRRHRLRWDGIRKTHKDFEQVFVTTRVPEHRLENWVRDLVGPLVAPLQDISAGEWRRQARQAAPALPRHERRKFIARTERGSYLLKFTGLGAEGRAKAARARELGAAGFTPPVVGFRHGFLVQDWVEDAAAPDIAGGDRERLIDRIAEYIAFRARRFPASAQDGAGLPELRRMLQVNVAEALDVTTAARLERRVAADAAAVSRAGPIHVDGRLHSWEWLETGGRAVKTDAIDHSRQHDLVGCQDPAWDIAGATVEFALTSGEAERLARAVSILLDGSIDRRLLAVFAACYPAFQLGLWQSEPAAVPAERERVAAHAQRYRDALLELAA